MTIKKWRRLTAIGIALGLCAAGVWAVARRASRGAVLVTISKDTTIITGPVRSDGCVDYIAALNRILGKDVTPQNNALVPFWTAMGPAGVLRANRAEYFRLLGMAVPAEDGHYFVPLDDFLKQRPAAVGADAIDEQLEQAQKRPWTKSEFPDLAAWLEANRAPLEIAIAASRRPRYYSPLVGDESGTLLQVILPADNQLRSAGRALLTRAMLRLAEGNTDASWQDLLATHRLARLCGQGFCLVDALVAISVDAVACRGDQAVCQASRLSAGDALRMRDELSRLPPLPSIADTVDRGERYSLLSAVLSIARGNPNESKGVLEKLGDDFTRNNIDWDIPLRITNSWCDRAVDALRKTNTREQHRALDELSEQLKLRSEESKRTPSLIHFQNDLSERVGQRIATLLFPELGRANDAVHTAEVRIDLTKLNFSLAAYRADHGSYPPQLGDLVPKYAAEIPKDVFTGNNLVYKPGGDNYLLYSVGRNGKDDGGRGYEDRENGTDGNGDDIAVRMSKSP